MFNNLANYLLGTTSNQQQQQQRTDEEEQQQQHLQTANLRLTSVVSDEDDWVLVDRDSEGNSELSSDESECEPNLTNEVDQFDALLLSRTSSTSSLPGGVCGSNVMEESWFLTPPPCFISAGPPVHMETSPLENLLIEHPSMSVYQQPVLAFRRHAALDVVDDEDADVEPEDEVEVGPEIDGYLEVRAVAAAAAAATALQREPRRNRVEVIRQQERQGVKNKQAQKVQIQKACQSLKRGYLERNNKAREVNCRNQRLRRGERSQGARRSHANNNRKC